MQKAVFKQGFFVILLAALSVVFRVDSAPAVVPLPQQMEVRAGTFQLTPDTRIYASPGSLRTARQLATELRPSTGFSLPAHEKWWRRSAIPSAIFLTTKGADTNLGPEGYELTVSSNSAVIRAPTQAGLFYGGQTLLQLLPPEIFSTNQVAREWSLPCVEIKDWPRFKWRGLMLDVSRHFYNKAEAERILDLMAMQKLNMFHLHLTDSQGWRLEIKKYPRLTTVGAWREHADITLLNYHGTNAHPAWVAAAPDKFAPDGRYGGFYTQNDIREMVAYAAARHITIVPEIELPGHSGAALAAYPEYGGYTGTNATDVPLGVRGRASYGIYNPANEQTFTFLDNVLSEVFKLFPGKYVHIGGDEVSKAYWNHSPECQALMQREGLKNAEELQSWFIKRMEKYVDAHGKTLVGWSEILQGGLAQNAVVMDWIGGARQAAMQGHDVVMTPNSHCYLNYYQSTNRVAEPRAQGDYLPLKKVYAFEPVPANLPAQFQSHILGAQGNLWTEWIASLPHVEYMLFPRLCALAEVDWSARDARNWDDFQSRLTVQERRLAELGVNYRVEPAVLVTQPVRLTTRWIDAQLSPDYPGFTGLSLDSLGKEHFPLVALRPPGKVLRPVQARQQGSRVEYRDPKAAVEAPPRWAIEVDDNAVVLESHWTPGDEPEPMVLNFDNRVCHVTLLGLMETNGAIHLPAIMHFPDQGSFRISAGPGDHTALGYAAGGDNVAVTFPPAAKDRPVVRYRLETVAIYPASPGIEADPRFDGFRRDWLNIFQISPRWRTLANHAASDTCAFCYYEYADMALKTPPLADGLTALDMVRQTLDRIMAGANAYGMPGHGAFPEYSTDTLPSLLISAEDGVAGGGADAWLAANYGQFRTWADKMLSTDHEGNGLIEYTLSGNSGSWPLHLKYRPANWWDTIGFGHQDAYANALAYRAVRGMETLARQTGHASDEARYHAAGDKIQAAYCKTFYDPSTGVLAGWRSSDGQLHDYYFLWVNGIAIRYGLVPEALANSIESRLLTKMKEAGYTRFDLGLPGNLIPVARKDYADHNPRFGGGAREDNADGFQIYENGGATGCFAYFTLAALYHLGRVEDADKIMFPMLDSFARGDFQGRGSNGMSKDWRTWDGTCWGYEGLLVDNYYALLAVMDRESALKK